jgi:DNA-binding response OmpR family regulator
MSTVLVYSDDPSVRERVRLAVGRRPDPDLGPLSYLEAADGATAVAAVDRGGVDLCVLDGEAWPTGGLGISRQLKNEVADPPAVIVLLARPDDRWLGRWSLAEAVHYHPVDPGELTADVVRLLKERAARPPVPAGRGAFGLRRR